MPTLRVYDGGDGDCLALRDGGETLFIFDTGRKGPYDDKLGFRAALDDALGRKTKGKARKGKPATVVISHVDMDHIGGLIAWVEDVLKHSKSWSEARALAQSEIKEVWCNVPPEDRGTFQSFGAPETATDTDPPIPPAQIGELNTLEWTTLILSNDNERRDVEQVMRLVHAVKTMRSSPGSAERQPDPDAPSNALRVLIDLIRLERGEEQRSNVLQDLQIRGRDFHGDFHVHGRYLEGYFRSGSLGVNIEYLEPRGRWHVWGTAIPVEEPVLSLLRHAETPQELLGRMVAEVHRQASKMGGLDPADARALAELKTLFGLEPYDDQVERLGLFVCLQHLGIKVVGWGKLVGVGTPFSPRGCEGAELIRPSADEINALGAEWQRLSQRLRVRRPLHLAMLTAASLSSSVKWEADTSVANLSSISLWVPNVGAKSSLVLTGDGLHGEVVAALAKLAEGRTAKRNVYYQVPHHGSAHNTNPEPSLASALQDALARRGKAGAELPKSIRPFVTGGQKKPADPATRKRPHPNVLEFFKSACKRKVMPVRDTILSDEREYVDFRLL